MELVAILILAVVAFIVAATSRSGYQSQKQPQHPLILPYQRRRYFFSRAEQRFYNDLICAIRGMGLTVFAKVRVADLLIMTQGTTGQEWWRAWGRISQKHADFVVLRPTAESDIPGSLEPVLVIELDDASHEQPDRQQRDQLVNAIYAQAGLPILHIPVAYNYDSGTLAAQIRASLGIPVPASAIGMPNRRSSPTD